MERNVEEIGTGFALGDFAKPERAAMPDGVARQRAWLAEQRIEKEGRLRRPARDPLTANIADHHVARVVPVEPDKRNELSGRALRFGYGIERQVYKGNLPIAALRACELFRRDWEAANSGGAVAIINPMRVRVDTSICNREDPGGRVGSRRRFDAACEALAALFDDDDCRASVSIATPVAVHCICEGKLLKDYAAAHDLDPRKATRALVYAARRLIAHYDPKPQRDDGA